MITGCHWTDCSSDRKIGTIFCEAHKEEHDNSVWVKSFRRYQDDIVKYGLKKAVFVIKDI